MMFYSVHSLILAPEHAAYQSVIRVRLSSNRSLRWYARVVASRTRYIRAYSAAAQCSGPVLVAQSRKPIFNKIFEKFVKFHCFCDLPDYFFL